jgi:hypothetical protein
VPSKFTVAVIWVSKVLRLIVALRMFINASSVICLQ